VASELFGARLHDLGAHLHLGNNGAQESGSPLARLNQHHTQIWSRDGDRHTRKAGAAADIHDRPGRGWKMWDDGERIQEVPIDYGLWPADGRQGKPAIPT
jgi:hypothetical protein